MTNNLKEAEKQKQKQSISNIRESDNWRHESNLIFNSFSTKCFYSIIFTTHSITTSVTSSVSKNPEKFSKRHLIPSFLKKLNTCKSTNDGKLHFLFLFIPWHFHDFMRLCHTANNIIQTIIFMTNNF
jgi:hypothetical protein